MRRCLLKIHVRKSRFHGFFIKSNNPCVNETCLRRREGHKFPAVVSLIDLAELFFEVTFSPFHQEKLQVKSKQSLSVLKVHIFLCYFSFVSVTSLHSTSPFSRMGYLLKIVCPFYCSFSIHFQMNIF